jgi:hypothetical protein
MKKNRLNPENIKIGKETHTAFPQKDGVEDKIKKLTKKHLPKDLNFVTKDMDEVLSHVWDTKGNYLGKLGKEQKLESKQGPKNHWAV